MNVAQSAGAHAAKAGSAAGAQHGQGKGHAAGDASGFMSLFSALEADADGAGLPGVAKDTDSSAQIAGSPIADGGLAANDVAALAALALPGQVTAAVNTAAAVADGGTGTQGAVLGGTPGAAAGKTLATQTQAASTAVVVPTGAGTVGQTAGAEQADTAASAQSAAVAGRGRGHAALQGESDMLKALKAQVQSADAGGGAQVAAAAGQSAAADATDAKGKAVAAAASAQPSAVQVADSKLAAELRMADTTRQGDTTALKVPGAEALLLTAAADSATREVQRAAERTASTTGSAGVDAGPTQAFAVTSGAATDSKPSASVDTTGLAAPDVQVAEQVSYWVSRDVQNAELKLDGLGSNPVEVSISLVGQEAHVEFRTDQPEIRQVLENAMPHLKDMLQNQGLSLTGTTVGTSGQGGQSAQEQKGRGDVRQAKMALASLAPAQSGRRMDATMGSAVDYFV